MDRRYQVLRPQHASRPSMAWRGEEGERRWLSRLVETMKRISRPDIRKLSCHPALVAATHNHLSHPVCSSRGRVSRH